MKKIFKPFIIVPNIPFIIILAIYVVYNLYKHNSVVELELMNDIPTELKDYIMEVYPKHLLYGITFFSYLSLFIYIWKLYM